MQYTIAMMGYGPEDESTVLELTYNYGVTEYTKGDAYGQVGLKLVPLSSHVCGFCQALVDGSSSFLTYCGFCQGLGDS